MDKLQSKIKVNKLQQNIFGYNMIKVDPGALVFTRGLSRTHSIWWVDKLLLATDSKAHSYDDIQGNDHVHRHHV